MPISRETLDLRLWPPPLSKNDYGGGTSMEVLVAATQLEIERSGQTRPGAAKVGYVVAVLVNAVMLVIANNLLAWGWAPFLTEDFEQILWILNISFVATIVVNAIYIGYDQAWFKSATQIGLGGISMAVAIRTYQVFPFDFSGYVFDWEPLARFVMILTTVGVGLTIISEAAKLVKGPRQASNQSPPSQSIEYSSNRSLK